MHACSRVVCEVEPLRELEVKLNGGTLVGPLEGIINDNVNLREERETETETETERETETETDIRQRERQI